MKFYPIKSLQSFTALSVTLGTLVACSTQSGTSAEPTLSSVIGNRFTILLMDLLLFLFYRCFFSRSFWCISALLGLCICIRFFSSCFTFT